MIEIDSGKPKDPAPFNYRHSGRNPNPEYEPQSYLPLSERSAGFVWFFSFLAQFKQLKKTESQRDHFAWMSRG